MLEALLKLKLVATGCPMPLCDPRRVKQLGWFLAAVPGVGVDSSDVGSTGGAPRNVSEGPLPCAVPTSENTIRATKNIERATTQFSPRSRSSTQSPKARVHARRALRCSPDSRLRARNAPARRTQSSRSRGRRTRGDNSRMNEAATAHTNTQRKKTGTVGRQMEEESDAHGRALGNVQHVLAVVP